MTWTRKSVCLVGAVVAAGLACLIAFAATSQADPRHESGAAPQGAAASAQASHATPAAEVRMMPSTGHAMQCADGSWARTVARGACWQHGGVAY
ncbi:MAG TPA: hypothetical protein VIF15_13515 [Polyangiaceae bacterium]|jgi:hypothetical protein